MANNKLQVWTFTKSQILLLREQARQHAEELKPFELYQARAQNDILIQFQAELGIPDEFPLTVDLNNFRFVERVEIPTPTGPVEVPQATDLEPNDPDDEPAELPARLERKGGLEDAPDDAAIRTE